MINTLEELASTTSDITTRKHALAFHFFHVAIAGIVWIFKEVFFLWESGVFLRHPSVAPNALNAMHAMHGLLLFMHNI